MFNTPSCIPSTEIMEQLEKKRIDNQRIADAAELSLRLTAEEIAKQLYQSIIEYQMRLSDKDDIAMQLVNFGTSVTISVDSIWYIGDSLIVFHGVDTSGKPMELVQHVSQLSFLLTCLPKTDPEKPKRMVGFGER